MQGKIQFLKLFVKFIGKFFPYRPQLDRERISLLTSGRQGKNFFIDLKEFFKITNNISMVWNFS